MVYFLLLCQKPEGIFLQYLLWKFGCSVQWLRCVWLFVTPWTSARQTSLSIISSWSLLKFMSIALVMPSNHLILCHSLLLPPSIFPSIRIFSNKSVLHIMWPNYWSFSFSIGPSNEYSGLISFRIDRLALLAAQGTLKSLLQHHSSKASVLWGSTFFMTTAKTIALTRWTFIWAGGKSHNIVVNPFTRRDSLTLRLVHTEPPYIR